MPTAKSNEDEVVNKEQNLFIDNLVFWGVMLYFILCDMQLVKAATPLLSKSNLKLLLFSIFR